MGEQHRSLSRIQQGMCPNPHLETSAKFLAMEPRKITAFPLGKGTFPIDKKAQTTSPFAGLRIVSWKSSMDGAPKQPHKAKPVTRGAYRLCYSYFWQVTQP